MLLPERVKHRKQHRGRMCGKAYRGSLVSFGDFGIKSMEPHRVTSRQIEACRLIITKAVSKTGKYWIRIFPDKPVTKKPAETRMGSGKGDVDHWEAVVKPGRIMFEFNGVDESKAMEVTRLVSAKLPMRIKLQTRVEQEAV
ncbi:MAG TPA: 50S ribosomal protein L16 [Caldisericia bacterium]|nr:50S ribosomal protein L16 [Caldisericia bacterium]